MRRQPGGGFQLQRRNGARFRPGVGMGTSGFEPTARGPNAIYSRQGGMKRGLGAENSAEWAIGGDLSVLPFLGFRSSWAAALSWKLLNSPGGCVLGSGALRGWYAKAKSLVLRAISLVWPFPGRADRAARPVPVRRAPRVKSGPWVGRGVHPLTAGEHHNRALSPGSGDGLHSVPKGRRTLATAHFQICSALIRADRAKNGNPTKPECLTDSCSQPKRARRGKPVCGLPFPTWRRPGP